MAYVKSVFLGVVAIVLIVIALANSAAVTLRLLPETMAGFLGITWSVTLPMFVVILGAVLVGVLVGFVGEWMRLHKHRGAVRAERRQKNELKRENEALRERRGETRSGSDEILALLEDGSVPKS